MEYLLKSSAVVVLFYICFSLFLKKETFFQHNRWFLIMGVIIAVIFPFIVIPIQIPVEPQIVSETVYSQNTTSNFVVAQPESTFNWPQLISMLYSIGFIVFLLQFLLQFGSLAVLLFKNPKHKDKQFTYVIIKNKLSPFSFFKWIFYNPDNFENEELDLILTHEKIHAKQLHSIDILLMQVVCILFWFNPLIWLYRREVRQNLEYIADYETQLKTTNQKDYQRLLLKTSVTSHNITLSNHFYNSLIKERIIMLKKSRSNKKQQRKYLLILPLLAGLLMSMNTEEIYVESKNEIEPSPSYTDIGDISKNQRIEVLFTNSMTDAQLDEIKKELQSHGVTMTINGLKRNSKDEIKAINIDFETKNGSTNYNVKSNKGIDPFYFNMSEDGSFGVGAHKETEIMIVTPLNSDTANTPERTFILSKDDGKLTEITNDTIAIATNGKTTVKRFYNRDSTNVYSTYRANFENDSLYLYKAKIDSVVANQLSNLKTDNYYQNDEPVKIISQSTTIHAPGITKNTISNTYNDKDKPLIVLDGTIVDDTSLKTISPELIESVTVLKGKKATDSYGEQGKNGVIEIKRKNSKSIKSSKSTETTSNPWSISRAEVTNVTFIDDEDSSKNGTLAYITKYTSDKVLEKHIVDLEAFDIKAKISKVKRNKKGEITSIKVSIQNQQGDQSSASWKNDDGIPGIEFGLSEGILVARTSTMN